MISAEGNEHRRVGGVFDAACAEFLGSSVVDHLRRATLLVSNEIRITTSILRILSNKQLRYEMQIPSLSRRKFLTTYFLGNGIQFLGIATGASI